MPLDYSDQARIQPDLIIQAPTGRRIVADTKYKMHSTPESGDLYQLVAYCRVLGITQGVIIVPGKSSDLVYRVADGVTRIDVLSINLSGAIAEIDQSLLNLANKLSSMLTAS